MIFDNEKYDIIDTFEENANQLILLAIENKHYEDVVIINKITKSDIINSDFLHLYRSVSSNVVSISETAEQIIIVNNYKDTQLLADYLRDNPLDFTERVRIAKSFLSQVSKYNSFSYPLQNLLIKSDQLTIKNGLLIFSDYLFLDDYNHNIVSSNLFASIGQTLKLILQLHKESLSSEISALNYFIEILITRESEYTSYNEIYNQFKILLSSIHSQDETIQYTELSKLDISNSSKQKVDLDFIKNKQKVKLEKSSAEVVDSTLSDSKNSLRQSDSFQELGKTYDSEYIDLEQINEDFSSPNILYTDEELNDSDLGINQNFKDDFKESVEEFIDISNNIIDEETDEDISVDFDEDDVIDTNLFDYSETEDNNLTNEILSILAELNDSEEIKEDPIKKTTIKDNNSEDDIIHDYDDLLPDSLFESWLDNNYAEDDEKAIEPVLEDITEHVVEDTTEHVVEDITESVVEDTIEPVLKDITEHVNNIDENFEHIEEILNRNKREHGDLYISDKESKSHKDKFVPSFLLFFVSLLLITTLLLYYTFTYI